MRWLIWLGVTAAAAVAGGCGMEADPSSISSPVRAQKVEAWFAASGL